MFTLTIAYCLATEVPAMDTCRAETMALWFGTEEACVMYVNELNDPRFHLVDAMCHEWTSMQGLGDDPA
jgi:hypothetical protein